MNNSLLPLVYGEQDVNLRRLEQALDVSIHARGQNLVITGDQTDVKAAEDVLHAIYRKAQAGYYVSQGELEALVHMYSDDVNTPDEPVLMDDDVCIHTPRKTLFAYSFLQGVYMRELMRRDVVFASGPAGTGKSYIAVAAAVALFSDHKVDRIILTRPAVEAGEKIGFLPGDIKDKVDPYLRPLYDALYDLLPAEKVVKCIESQQIEIAPLAFMRGRTLKNAFIILDEAQNTTPMQMKMFLTRLGEGSRMAITGDLTQVDLPSSVPSGFRDALETLKHIDEISVVRFGQKDIIRHPLTSKIVEAYESRAAREARTVPTVNVTIEES